jgi:hypothetical protein
MVSKSQICIFAALIASDHGLEILSKITKIELETLNGKVKTVKPFTTLKEVLETDVPHDISAARSALQDALVEKYSNQEEGLAFLKAYHDYYKILEKHGFEIKTYLLADLKTARAISNVYDVLSFRIQSFNRFDLRTVSELINQVGVDAINLAANPANVDFFEPLIRSAVNASGACFRALNLEINETDYFPVDLPEIGEDLFEVANLLVSARYELFLEFTTKVVSDFKKLVSDTSLNLYKELSQLIVANGFSLAERSCAI